MEPNPKASPELHLKDLSPQLDGLANGANLEDMIGGLVAATNALADLPLAPASSVGAGAAIKTDRAHLVKSVDALGMAAKKLASDLRSARAGSASASVFKPRL